MLLPLGWAEHHEHTLEAHSQNQTQEEVGSLTGAKESAVCLGSVR